MFGRRSWCFCCDGLGFEFWGLGTEYVGNYRVVYVVVV